MCESGINVDQLRMSITQTESALGLAQEWLEELHHLADHGKKHDVSVELAQATVLLGEARVKLEKAVVFEDHTGGAMHQPGFEAMYRWDPRFSFGGAWRASSRCETPCQRR